MLNARGYNVIGLEFNGNKLQEGMRYWDKLGIDFEEITDASSAVDTTGKLYFLERNARSLDDFPDRSVSMATAFYISGYMVRKNGTFCSVGRILKFNGDLTITAEGPTVVPTFLRKAVVKLIGRFFEPNDLKLASTFAIKDSQVYDKLVLVYKHHI